MDTIDKLEKLTSLCKASVSITINGHKDYYKSVEQWFNEAKQRGWIDDADITYSVYSKMKELDTTVCVQYYPDNSVEFCVEYHFDIETALDICIEQREWEIGERI